MKKPFCAINRVRAVHRNQSGIYLLELMIALATTSILATALLLTLSETMRFSNASQSEILAGSIAQELMDNARNTPYGNLINGEYDLLVNRTTDGETGPFVDPRPLLLDFTGQNWTQASQNNIFRGSVTETIADGAYPNTKEVSVQVAWQDSARGNRKYNLSTLISQNGICIHN